MFRVLGTVKHRIRLGRLTSSEQDKADLVCLFGRTSQIVSVEPGGCDLTRPQATAFTSKGDGAPKLSNFPQEMCSATAQGGNLFHTLSSRFLTWRILLCHIFVYLSQSFQLLIWCTMMYSLNFCPRNRGALGNQMMLGRPVGLTISKHCKHVRASCGQCH